jgi:hypothetical protein
MGLLIRERRWFGLGTLGTVVRIYRSNVRSLLSFMTRADCTLANVINLPLGSSES